jgi:hypothetical protein
MKVKAAPGLLCPMENKPREYITDTGKGMDVPDTAYYRRLVTDGSLVEIVATPKTKGGDQ